MDHLLTLLRAAAEDTRLRILALAAREDLTVSDYVHVLGQSQPRVSRHLKLLVEAGLLERFREAQFTRFRLTTGGDDAALVREFVRRLDPRHARIAADRSRLDGLLLDFSRHFLSDETLPLLTALARARELPAWIERMFSIYKRTDTATLLSLSYRM